MIKFMIPWVVFPYLVEWVDGAFAQAVILVAVLIAILCYGNLRKGFIVESVLIFSLIVMAVLSLFWSHFSNAESVKFFLYGLLSVVGWVSILLGYPFTMQYSGVGVDIDVLESDSFFEINNIITKVWCVVFSINWALAGASIVFEDYWPVFVIGSYINILIAAVVSEVFPDIYLKKENLSHD